MLLTCKLTSEKSHNLYVAIHPWRQYSTALIIPAPGIRQLETTLIVQSSSKSFRLANHQLLSLRCLAFPIGTPIKVMASAFPSLLLCFLIKAWHSSWGPTWWAVPLLSKETVRNIKVFFQWHWVIPLNGSDLSLSSLSHLYKVRLRHKTALHFLDRRSSHLHPSVCVYRLKECIKEKVVTDI